MGQVLMELISCMNIGKASNHIKTTVEDYKLLIEGREK